MKERGQVTTFVSFQALLSTLLAKPLIIDYIAAQALLVCLLPPSHTLLFELPMPRLSLTGRSLTLWLRSQCRCFCIPFRAIILWLLTKSMPRLHISTTLVSYITYLLSKHSLLSLRKYQFKCSMENPQFLVCSRPTHREIEERFALRAPTPWTNRCLDTWRNLEAKLRMDEKS